MNLADELARFDPHTTSPEMLAASLVKWVEQAKKDAGEIRRKDIKIDALTYELAWHKRIKFAAKSEAFSAQQRDLFDESLAEDLQAIEAELEQLTPPAPRSRKKPAGRKPLPPELPRVVHHHEPESCSCGACGADLVKIGEDRSGSINSDSSLSGSFASQSWPQGRNQEQKHDKENQTQSHKELQSQSGINCITWR